MRHLGILVLAVAACRQSGPSAAPTPTLDSVPKHPPVASGAAPPTALDRVREHVRRVGRHDRETPIDVREVASPLAGLTMAAASPAVHDHPGYHCLVHGDAVWCDAEEGALERVVGRYTLGAAPQTLTDEQWVDLVAFVYHLSLYRSPNNLTAALRDAPPEVTAKLHPPRVVRPSAGGVEIGLCYRVVEMERGFVGLGRIHVAVSSSNRVTAAPETLWPK